MLFRSNHNSSGNQQQQNGDACSRCHVFADVSYMGIGKSGKEDQQRRADDTERNSSGECRPCFPSPFHERVYFCFGNGLAVSASNPIIFFGCLLPNRAGNVSTGGCRCLFFKDFPHLLHNFFNFINRYAVYDFKIDLLFFSAVFHFILSGFFFVMVFVPCFADQISI